MSSSRRVLIVDDNKEIVAAASVRLRAAGFEPLTAFDGNEGVASAVRNHPDAIVLDVRMPIKDGLTALAELKSNRATRDIPIVMLSASIVDQQAALEAGARYFLKKPYDGNHLIQALSTVMSSRSQSVAASVV